MASYQKSILVGNLGGNPDMRFMPSGEAVCSFSLALNETVGMGDNQKKATMWVKISTFGKTAENANKYLKKGSKVLVEGRFSFDATTGGCRIWTGNEGTPHASFEFKASSVQFLDSAPSSQNGENSNANLGMETEASF